MRKILMFLFCIIILTSLVIAQEYKMEISASKDIFEAGEKITFKITLLDSQNNPINDEVFVVIEDAEKRIKVEKSILSNKFINIDLGEKANYGQGTITAQYKDIEAKGFFEIKINELAKFELQDDNLIITNIGNTKYTKTVQITIGETTGSKYPKLNVGEKVSYKLVAPEGVYNIKVSDGKTTLTQEEVQLTGTGQVIGILDETPSKRSPFTGVGGRNPGEESDETLLTYMKSNKFTYVFVFIIFGAMILLAIERRFKKKINQ